MKETIYLFSVVTSTILVYFMLREFILFLLVWFMARRR